MSSSTSTSVVGSINCEQSTAFQACIADAKKQRQACPSKLRTAVVAELASEMALTHTNVVVRQAMLKR